ncbi:Bifunctional purine biosynthetic protein ADE1 [Neolecta irregularis DAH-3]|uniref:Bifunctional purine biosynthetic protein ADE1 n=1 Tax=Neolecta irregularis (strain DAH-3) TaxID=1198029 RepID=A0A1U7LWI1_NEOID|nr:Bifunctional purine biosynthetic protein ADE1 [Neolecta irregularis DAH-3]|eukprot:OLL27027.1 Bifunctional purine biosynthetic protein ADE1 [Neolecta irregularis DAH-3]
MDTNESLSILLVGNGGREHALAWKLSSSLRVKEIFVAPGNGGTDSGIPKTHNIPIEVNQYGRLVQFARERNIGLVVPGPELPLVEGISDYFKKAGIPCFGPEKKAARMEGSKTFSKGFLERHSIPTASFKSFSVYEEAQAYLDSVNHPIVIKASGLAAGKGVIIPQSKEEGTQTLKEIMRNKIFGNAGDEVVIEEFLEGEEISILAFSDGYTITPLPAAQDHKRILEGDQGPNTGGMGCYAPASVATPTLLAEIQQRVLKPTVDGMRKDGYPFVGMLFTGLMLTSNGPKVLEYNVRFGDPETQTLMPLLDEKTDLAEIMLACVERRLDFVHIGTKPGFVTTVVMAAKGYPGDYQKGETIKISKPEKDTIQFHAGTSTSSGQLVTSGGRVIAVSAYSDTLKSAVQKAYEGIRTVSFDGAFYRKDIAHRELNRSSTSLSQITYASSGVSIENGNRLVQDIKRMVKTTSRLGADAEIGGFGGIFDLKAAGFLDPLLVAATDGIGTKVKIAQAIGKHDTVGIDLVAMNVNDLIVQGAEPLFFLDYFACGKLDVHVAKDFVKGVVDGCKQANCALVGGETAEMPSLYQVGEYDAAGTSVGAVNRNSVLPKTNLIEAGDLLLGLASSGCHSNGFSLIRKVLETLKIEFHDSAPWDVKLTVGEALLEPTRIYVDSILRVTKQNLVKGVAHITGGGFVENIPRVLPKHLTAVVDVSTWKLKPVFQWLLKTGLVPANDLARTVNMGIGMVLVVAPEYEQKVVDILKMAGEEVYRIGILEERREGMCACRLENVNNWYT